MKDFKLKVAVTGGIGSGKSTVARYLDALGYPVFSCDEIYKEIFPKPQYQEQLSKLFPDCMVDGVVDRKMLARKVFSDQNELKKLNELAHKRIMETLLEKMNGVSQNIVFAEVPLLFECGYEKDFDKVIVVLRNRAARLQSVCLRDNLTADEAKKRMAKQFDYDSANNISYLKECGYFLIENNATEKSLCQSIESLLVEILK